MTTVEYHFGLVDSLAPSSMDKPVRPEVPPTATPQPEASQPRDEADVPLSDEPLNRLGQVRRQQEMSMRSVGRQTGVSIRVLREQEQPGADLRISELRRWQKALDVPMAELLEEPDTQLSAPVMERARYIRLMKTAAAIQEQAESEGIQRMASMLVDQLVEVMPELSGVTAWHTFGQRRGLDEMGQVVERTLPASALFTSCRRD